MDPEPDDVDIEDIAHSLSNQCRFSGHTYHFYSVAEHCVRMSEVVPYEDAMWALLHDASEAYLVDLPRPIKHATGFEGYRDAEMAVMLAVLLRFNLPLEEPASVHDADLRLLETERRDLMTGAELWTTGATPLPEKIEPWWPKDAEIRFLRRYERLEHDRLMAEAIRGLV
jgi:hypothetical protein